jgi:hypothetical protein
MNGVPRRKRIVWAAGYRDAMDMTDHRQPIRPTLIEDVLQSVGHDAGHNGRRQKMRAGSSGLLAASSREEPKGYSGCDEDMFVRTPRQSLCCLLESGVCVLRYR